MRGHLFVETSDPMGVVRFSDMPQGTYHLRPLSRRHVQLGEHRASQRAEAVVPGNEVTLCIAEVRALVLRIVGDQVAAHRVVRWTGTTDPVGLHAEVCNDRHAALSKQEPNALVFVRPPELGTKETTVEVELCLEQRGWLPARTYPLQPCSKVVPETVDCSSLPLPASPPTGLVTVVVRDVEGTDVPRMNEVQLVATDETGAALRTFVAGKTVALPPGKIQIRCLSDSYCSYLSPVTLEVTSGTESRVAMTCRTALAIARFELFANGQPIQMPQWTLQVLVDGKPRVTNRIVKMQEPVPVPVGACEFRSIVPGFATSPVHARFRRASEVQKIRIDLTRRH